MIILYPVLILLKTIYSKKKIAKYNDLEDMVYRMQLTYDEIRDKLDLRNLPTKKQAFL